MEDAHGSSAPKNTPAPDACLAGGGEIGARMRVFDWAQTPVGPMERWPQSLKTAVQILLGSRYPMFVWWGSELIQFYNDVYASKQGALIALNPQEPLVVYRQKSGPC